MIQEPRALATAELPRCAQIEPVGRPTPSFRRSAIALRVDGLRNAPAGLLSFDAFCRLVDQLPELEELRLQGGGDPLAHPRFFDMVRYAARRGARVSTTTRLQRFSQARAEECVASGLQCIHVPLDGAGTREYDFSRRGPRYERMLRHLRFLAQARRAKRSLWPQVTLGAVLMRRTVAGIPGIVRLAHEHGADSVVVQRLAEFVESNGLSASHRRIRQFLEAEALTDADVENASASFAEARAVANELNVGLQLPELAHAGTAAPHVCPWPWEGLYVTASGEAKSCFVAAGERTQPQRALGNVLRQGVAAVWSGEAYRELRERHLAGELPVPCSGCPHTHRVDAA
ncbi:MAG: SPASM domain-containing protein [Betaproteobacteria bacterium]|nr:SPASM domain-containing protein [Betaproteobacteria bacterium]